jgi:superfamily II DNA helicase RecQ
MKDQVEQLTQSGVAAAVLNSSLSAEAYRRNIRLVKQKKAKLLYLAPEALLKSHMLALLSAVKVECLAIDEAHCISQWGHDFRPEYRRLAEARDHFSDAVCVALTATATPRVREDIQTSLHMAHGREFTASFNRENLFIRILPKNNPVDQTIQFLRRFPDQSGIIYCYSRKQVEDLNAILENEGFSVRPYHAGLSDLDRHGNQEAFTRDDAQKFLSCVKRTGERFGSNHLIDVLRGSQAKRVLQFGHHKLSTYGIGESYSKKQWQQLSRQFLHRGLMVQDMEFGSLKLTAKGWDVLKGDLKVKGELEQTSTAAPSTPQPARLDDLDYDRELFEILRQTRKKLADKSGVPPFVIFADKTLVEMATFFPQSSENFLEIHGIGTVKAQKFGTLFMQVIGSYCREKQIQEQPKKPIKPFSTKEKKISPAKTVTPRHLLVGEIFNSGRSMAEIMDIFDIKQTTVIDHLNKYVMAGNALRGDEILALSTLPTDQKNAALKAFDQCGSEYLKPAFDFLNGQVDYEALKILRLYHLTRINRKSETRLIL